MRAAPDLKRGLRIAKERDRRPAAAARRDPIRRVGRARLGPRHRRGGLVASRLERHEVAVEKDGIAGRYEVRVRHEVLEPVPGEQFLDAGPDPPDAATVAPGRRGPLVARPIRALREPDAAGRLAEVAAVRFDGGAELEVDRLVAAEEREVAVGRGTGDHLDVAAALELGEGAGDVAADPAMHLPHALVELFPKRREPHDLLVPAGLEVCTRFHTGAPNVLVVKREFLLKLRRGELLRQDRREVDRPLGRDAVGDEAVGRLEQREVALERGLAEPVAAVRPPAVIQHHREVGVQDQREGRAHRWFIGAYERAGRKRS